MKDELRAKGWLVFKNGHHLASCASDDDAQAIVDYHNAMLACMRAQVEALRKCMKRYQDMLSNEECDCTMDGGAHTCGKMEANRELDSARAVGAIE